MMTLALVGLADLLAVGQVLASDQITEDGTYTFRLTGSTSDTSSLHYWRESVTVIVPSASRVKVWTAKDSVGGSNFAGTSGADILPDAGSSAVWDKTQDVDYNVHVKSRNGQVATYEVVFTVRVVYTYYASFDLQGGQGSVAEQSVGADEFLLNVTPPSRDGYEFLGFYTERNGGGTQYFDATGRCIEGWKELSGRTLYADWRSSVHVIPQDLRASTSIARLGETVNFTYVVKNTGSAVAPAGRVRRYLDGVEIEGHDVSALKGGESRSFAYELENGFNTEGNHLFRVDTANGTSQVTVRVPQLDVNVSSLELDAETGHGSLEVRANTAWQVSSVSERWLTVSPIGGDTDKTLTITATRNASTSSRNATFRINDVYGHSHLVTVWQGALAAPEVPVLVASRGTSASRIDLSWTPALHALSYNVYRSETATGDRVRIAAVTDTKYSDKEVLPNKPYYYWVEAVNEVHATVGNGRVGYVPSNLSASDETVVSSAAGCAGRISVTCNSEWCAIVEDDWIELSDVFGSGDGRFGYLVRENATDSSRSGVIVLHSGMSQRRILVEQAGRIELSAESGTLSIDTDGVPSMRLSDGRSFSGSVSDGVAIFSFDYLKVGSGVKVNVSGLRPFKLISRTDMMINADIDVSGSEVGRCGGGAGGAGGKGGEAGGGAGGEGGDGGAGGSYFTYESSTGECGESGRVGKQSSGADGEKAGIAFNSSVALSCGGVGGAGGEVGAAGERSARTNGGSGGYLHLLTSSFGTTGTAEHLGMENGEPGNDGGCGGAGKDGHQGAVGVNDFSALLNTKKLVAGSAGGGGGGGGSGGSGGGGQGGGGGGGSAYVLSGYKVTSVFPNVFGPAEGQDGGAGGNGGNGGDGGVGGHGGQGGNGGGVFVLQAFGRLSVSGRIDISSGGDVSPGPVGDFGIGSSGNEGSKPPFTPDHIAAARGGQGGRGGDGGKGGFGGNGGCGAPGMVKLYGSVVDLGQSVVVADNGNGDTADERCGAVTYRSCLTDGQLTSRKPQFRQKVLEGRCRDVEELLVPSVYDERVLVPCVSPLRKTRAGSAGILDSLEIQDSRLGRLEVSARSARLTMRRLADFYEGFDQLFIEKVVDDDGHEAVRIAGRAVSLGRMARGDVWTACVPKGTTLSLDIEEMTVTFDAAGGSCSESLRRCFSSLSIGSLPRPSKAGALFVGWFTQRDGGTPVDASAVLGCSQTLYAHWVERVDLSAVEDPPSQIPYDPVLGAGRRFAILYRSGAGPALTSRQEVPEGSVTTLSQCPFKVPSGKTRFAGWACSNGRRYDDGMLVFDLAKPGETVTMTAIWE